MFNVTGGEIIILLLVALIVLGPEKLPDAIRRFGHFYGEFKRMSTGFQSELRSALDEPMREMRETANLAKGIFEEPVNEIRSSGDALTKSANEVKDIFAGKATTFDRVAEAAAIGTEGEDAAEFTEPVNESFDDVFAPAEAEHVAEASDAEMANIEASVAEAPGGSLKSAEPSPE